MKLDAYNSCLIRAGCLFVRTHYIMSGGESGVVLAYYRDPSRTVTQSLHTDTLIRRSFSMCRPVWFRPRPCLTEQTMKNLVFTVDHGVSAYGKHNVMCRCL